MTNKGAGQMGGDGQPVVGPILYRTKADAAYAEVRRRILVGALPALTPLNQERLAAALGVSTTPVREALRRLESEGLVKTVAHREVLVAGLDLEEMDHLYDVKEVLESFAASQAARRHTDEDRSRIEKAAAATLESNLPEDQAWVVNRQLHEAIYRASHNPVLVEFMDTLWQRYERYRLFLGFLVLDEPANAEHEPLAHAVLRRAPKEAADLMRAHLKHARRLLRGAVAQHTWSLNQKARTG